MRLLSGLALVLLLTSITACSGKGSKKGAGPTATAQPSTPVEPTPNEPTPDPGTPPTDTETTPPTDPDTDPSTGNLPPQALTFKVKLKLFQMNQAQIDKFKAAAQIINNVIASDELRDQVVNYTYIGVKRFVKNKGMTNEKIYLSILDAAEKLQPAKDNTMELAVQLYVATFPEESYSYTNTLKISMNNAYFRTVSNKALAAKLMHHWLHKLGFDYANTTPEAKENTVPIAIARMINQLGME